MRAAVLILAIGVVAVGTGAVAHSSDKTTSVAVLALRVRWVGRPLPLPSTLRSVSPLTCRQQGSTSCVRVLAAQCRSRNSTPSQTRLVPTWPLGFAASVKRSSALGRFASACAAPCSV